MRKWGLLILAVVVMAASLLTVVRAPPWIWAWKLAILVGEFGHWLVVVPAGIAIVAIPGKRGLGRSAVFVLCLGSAGCLLRPVFSARGIAASLPMELQAAFGPAGLPGPAFSFRQLYRLDKTPEAEVTTEIFSRADGQELKLDFYPASARASAVAGPLADTSAGKPPACIVVIHGGGWDAGDRLQLPGLNHRLALLGYAVAAIDYRLAPRWQWPAPKEDVRAALAWLKENAGRLGLDASNFVLLGRSAGAQIAEVVGYADRDPAIRGVITFYGPSDMVFGYHHSDENDAIKTPSLMRAYLGGTPEQQPARYDDASALRFVVHGSPPTLMLHGYLDTLAWHRHDERLAARLGEAGVPHYFLSLPWATHGFDYNPDGPGGQLADYAIRDFLRAVTGAPRPARR